MTTRWVQSSYEIRPGENSVLPSTSKNTGDAALLYFNAKNLTNTALKFTEGRDADRVIQREFY